jgi:diacylglycerol kinase (ATP)
MKKRSIFNLVYTIHAARNPIRGLKVAFKNEASLRQEVFLFIILIPLALYLSPELIIRAVLLGSWLLVIIVELLNTAIETIVDRIGTDHHHLSGKAKDIAAGAVLVSLINALLMWGLVIIHKIFL